MTGNHAAAGIKIAGNVDHRFGDVQLRFAVSSRRIDEPVGFGGAGVEHECHHPGFHFVTATLHRLRADTDQVEACWRVEV